MAVRVRSAAIAGIVLALTACAAPVQTGSPRPAASGLPASLAVVGERAAHTATTLPTGELLVAGGCVVDGCRTATADTFVLAADGRSARLGPAMSDPRDAHTATLLPDGRVVLVGGFAGEGQSPLSSIDVFDPATGTIAAAAPLELGRGGHAAALTGDGRVLVVGGWTGPRSYTATTEIFDPGSGTVTAGPDLPVGADALDAVTLSDGRVLVSGGQVSSGVGTAMAEIFDPATGAWIATDPMRMERFKHAGVLLADGSVLIMGGTSDDDVLLASTEIFDPASGRFADGPDLAEPRYKMTGGALVLGDGRVVVAGGGRLVEMIDLASGTSRLLGSFDARGSFATLNRLGSGDLVVIGGYDDRINLRGEVRLFSAADL